jgi:hypothetical protein
MIRSGRVLVYNARAPAAPGEGAGRRGSHVRWRSATTTLLNLHATVAGPDGQVVEQYVRHLARPSVGSKFDSTTAAQRSSSSSGMSSTQPSFMISPL